MDSNSRVDAASDAGSLPRPRIEEVGRLANDLAAMLERAGDAPAIEAVLESEAVQRLMLLLDRVAGRDRADRPGPGLAALMATSGTPTDDSRRDAQVFSKPVVDATVARMLAVRMDEPPRDAGSDDDDTWSVPGSAPPLVSQEALFDTLLAEIEGVTSLQGTSHSLPFPVVLGMIGDSRRTGALHVRMPGERLRFDFVRGAVVGTWTSAPPAGQRLGDLVVAMGMVTSAQRDRAVAECERASGPLGRVLVEQGLLTVAQLSEALLAQVEARFERVFRADFVAYAFVNREYDEGDGRIRFSASEVLIRSACRADESDGRTPGSGS